MVEREKEEDMVGGRRIPESTPPLSWVVAGEGGRRRKMKVRCEREGGEKMNVSENVREEWGSSHGGRYDVVGCMGCVWGVSHWITWTDEIMRIRWNRRLGNRRYSWPLCDAETGREEERKIGVLEFDFWGDSRLFCVLNLVSKFLVLLSFTFCVGVVFVGL